MFGSISGGSPGCQSPAMRRNGLEVVAGTAIAGLLTLYELVLIEDFGESAESVSRRSRRHWIREDGGAGNEQR